MGGSGTYPQGSTVLVYYFLTHVWFGPRNGCCLEVIFHNGCYVEVSEMDVTC